jgi:uncharacterized membrane protein YtjA (UPF0391 family)
MMDKYLLIVVFHVAVVAPMLMFVGFSRAATPDWVYNVLFGVGLLVLLYHIYKAIGRYFAGSPFLWVNLMHTLLIAPLLIWIGYNGKKTGRGAYDMLLLSAFAAFGFHLYRLVVLSQTFIKTEEA